MNIKKVLFFLALAIGIAVGYQFFRREIAKPRAKELESRNLVPATANNGTAQVAQQSSGKDNDPKEGDEPNTSPKFRWGKWEHAKIDDWLDQGNACALLNSELLYEAPLREILPHLLVRAKPSSSSTLPNYVLEDLARAFSADSEEEMLVALRRHSHYVLRFYEALVLAGLVEGLKAPITKNLYRASTLLQMLSQERKENGAILLYLAKVKMDQGIPISTIRPILEAGYQAQTFSTYTTDVMQAIYELGLQSPAYWPLAEAFRIHLPVVDYSAIRAVVMGVLNVSDAPFAEQTYAFAVKLMQKNETAAQGSEIVYWLAIEHATAKTIARAAWKKARPSQELPAEAKGDYRELIKKGIVNRAMPDALSEVFLQGESCEKSYPKLFGLLQKERDGYRQRANR